MNRVFSIETPFRVPDGTLVASVVNPGDSKSDLPFSLLDDLSVAAGIIEPGTRSKIHLMAYVTQVTFLLEGRLQVCMMDEAAEAPYTLDLGPMQAVLTRAGTFFQLINPLQEPCRVLYIVSPSYLHERGEDGQVVYDDSVVLEEGWDDLARLGWDIRERTPSRADRDAAYRRMAARASAGPA